MRGLLKLSTKKNKIDVGFVTIVLQFGYNLLQRLLFIYFAGMSVGVSHSEGRR